MPYLKSKNTVPHQSGVFGHFVAQKKSVSKREKKLLVDITEIANRFKILKNYLLKSPVSETIIPHSETFIPKDASGRNKLNVQYRHLS